MKPFDLLHTPLEDGASLIEASAGTGKTHTIAGLFLRLLVEKQIHGEPIHVDEILVVTYTEAATEELRDRIRQLLARAVAGFETGRSDDPLIAKLLAAHTAHRDALRERLTLSLNCFDLAPIYTIHGFCQRALQDRAFESGSLFDIEVLADQTALMQDIADDFWRRNFYQASPVRVAFALKREFSPAKFLPLLKTCISHPRLQFRSRVGDATSEEIAVALEHGFAEARQVWREQGPQIKTCFGSAANWGNKPYHRDDEMAGLYAQLERAFSETHIETGALDSFTKFSATRIRAGVNPRKKLPPPAHPFFEACDDLVRLEEDYATALQKDFFHFALCELRARKEHLKQISYDDMLTRLNEALAHPGSGPALAQELRRKYRAALIDEFQDTDPVQSEIFQQIFVAADVRRLTRMTNAECRLPNGDQSLLTSAATKSGPASLLFLIGDPKQAIYGFRGADIFTYMQAAQRTDRGFTLGENWRSEAGLVRAVNTIFGSATAPFVFEKIRFAPVAARGKADDEPLTFGGRREPPLQIWFCPRDEGEIPKGRADAELPRAVAAEIARLLNSDAKLGDRRLRPQDFAVLVMTHRQARLVQAALNDLKIPSVQQTQESVFATDEAVEMLRLLTGISQPANESAVRAALATRLLGHTGAGLHALQGDEAGWQQRLQQFRDYFDLWLERGFTPMLRQLLEEQAVRARLLGLPDGERALTNVLHLGEALHQAATNEKLGVSGLLKWLATHIENGQTATEEHQLRLERDENAVQLVTVHKSKGLQYEIVFAPFCWRDSDLKLRRQKDDEQQVLFHARTGELVRDLGPDFAPAHVNLAKEERLAENVRLLYVALTRARHRCYLAWGAFNGSGNSAPAWLFHRPARGPSRPAAAPNAEETTDQPDALPQSDLLRAGTARAPEEATAWKLDLKNYSDAQMQQDLEHRVEVSREGDGPPAIEVRPLPLEPGEPYRPADATAEELAGRVFTGEISRDWRIASFSWLTQGRRDELPDRDSAEPAAKGDEGEASGIFAFPRGTKPGTCLHEIFEQLDFTERDPVAMEKLVTEKLRAHGFGDLEFLPAIGAMLQQTLAVPLAPADLTLARVPMADRLNELEFCFPIKKLSPPRLRDVFARCGNPEVMGDFAVKLERLNFDPVGGFLKGFIDLVFRFAGRFYLVDWKSNWLGRRVEDYGPAALRAEMANHFYTLQYHLYTVALHQYLTLRLPGYNYAEHFGGVRYVFVRGVEPARPELGIFRDRPPEDLVRELSELLIAKEEAHG